MTTELSCSPGCLLHDRNIYEILYLILLSPDLRLQNVLDAGLGGSWSCRWLLHLVLCRSHIRMPACQLLLEHGSGRPLHERSQVLPRERNCQLDS